MQLIRSFEQDLAAPVGLGMRIILLTTEGRDGALARRLAGLGGQVDCHAEMNAGLAQLIEDPYRYGLLVIDCDGFGGLQPVRQTCLNLVGQADRVPVLMISRDCQAQIFPNALQAPVVLRAPVSAVSLRVGFEHALRERLALRVN